MGRILPSIFHPTVESAIPDPVIPDHRAHSDVMRGRAIVERDEIERKAIEARTRAFVTFPHREPKSIHSPAGHVLQRFEPPIPVYARRKQRFSMR